MYNEEWGLLGIEKRISKRKHDILKWEGKNTILAILFGFMCRTRHIEDLSECKILKWSIEVVKNELYLVVCKFAESKFYFLYYVIHSK